ncbi:MAG TPA: GNAT family N-acetyltransferase [Solirubrobacteraceae bacterium]|nr:GNAT family N-acetyltransferase [Solirubrobacteraceae bacterium]
MLQQAQGLTDTALEAIAGLERRVVAADGGRLKLEWSTLRSRPADQMRDLLWWEDGRLLGFLGIYGFNFEYPEVTGMVDPDARRRQIGRALLDAALPLCRALDKKRLLLVVPRTSPGGERFAHRYGMTYDHSEHALILRSRPETAAARSELSLRRPTLADAETLTELYGEAFGYLPSNLEELITSESPPLVIDCGDEIAGTIAAVREGQRGAIYGFIIAPRLRGRGLGREVLRRVCRDLFDAGMTHVDLEVEVENDRALALYTSVGFELVATDDYYELLLS